jgi:hypothetical protein
VTHWPEVSARSGVGAIGKDSSARLYSSSDKSLNLPSVDLLREIILERFTTHPSVSLIGLQRSSQKTNECRAKSSPRTTNHWLFAIGTHGLFQKPKKTTLPCRHGGTFSRKGRLSVNTRFWSMWRSARYFARTEFGGLPAGSVCLGCERWTHPCLMRPDFSSLPLMKTRARAPNSSFARERTTRR